MDAERKYIYIADPVQKEAGVKISFTDLKMNKRKNIQINLPKNELAGSSISTSIDME